MNDNGEKRRDGAKKATVSMGSVGNHLKLMAMRDFRQTFIYRKLKAIYRLNPKKEQISRHLLYANHRLLGF